MSLAPGGLLSRLAAILLLVAALAAFWVTIVQPVHARLAGLAADIEQQRQLLGRLQLRDRTTDTLAAREAKLATLSKQRLLLSGESDAVKLAALQGQVTDLATEAGLRLTSVEPQPVRTQGSLRLVGLDVRLISNLDDLQKLLVALEKARPVTVVTAVHAVPAIEADGRYADRLSVRLSVTGASAAQQPKAATGAAEERR